MSISNIMVRNANGEVLDLRLRSKAGSKRKTAKVKANEKSPHDNFFLNLKKEKTGAKPLGGGHAGNGTPSPETHTVSVPQPARQEDLRGDRKADDVVSHLLSATKQSSVLLGSADQASWQDRKENKPAKGGGIWGWAAAGVGSLIVIGAGILLGGKK